jgi:4-amino-4-deoxy-L-arabinose transferase-like glycosyltransferase
MNDAPSVPLQPERLSTASAFPWKERSVSLAVLVGGAALALLAMCARPGLPGGLWLGLIGTCAASVAALRFAELESAAQPAGVFSARTLLAPVLHGSGALVVFWAALRWAVLGVLPQQTWLLAVVVPAAFVWLVLAIAVAAGRLGFLSDPELPLWRRHGLWLLVLGALLYLPRLGSFGLIDCWETHYGEVAREMLSRDDWISLWWAQDNWFWSKPVLNFWAQGLSFSALGVAWAPDQMIAGMAVGRTPQPEWAARLPIVLMALIGQQIMYIGLRRYVGRLAAFLGALVLLTSPYWYLLARQSMADMPYVAPLTGAMGCLLLALAAHPDEQVRTVELRLGRAPTCVCLRLSGYHLLFALVLLLVLPQVLYLASRNVTLHWADFPLRLGWHADQVLAGSPGNCELPGNAPCRPDAEASSAALPPLGAALIYASACGVLLWLRRGERRAKRLYYLAAWLLTGVSFLAKGAPGLILVLFTLGGFLVARGRLRELAHVDGLGLGLVFVSAVAPWFLQEFLRHGSEFFERLFIHDMYLRAFDHVHDTNKGDDTSFRYYVWQLGYGLFPWSGLAAAAVLYCMHRTLGARNTPQDEPGGVSDVTYLCVLWMLAAFGMFAITGTKYHHYALPLVPPIAMLTGVFLAGLMQRRSGDEPAALADGAWAIGAAAVVLLCGRDLAVTRPGDVEGAARLIQLVTYNYGRSWPKTLDYSLPLWLLTGAAALGCLALLASRIRRWAALGICAVSVLSSVWVMDRYLIQLAPHWGQRETIGEYYKQRAGPEEPLVAYQLNWKGENFYTGNNVSVFVSSGKRFTEWVGTQKKNGVQVMFFTTEHTRVGTLQRELGSPQKFELLTDATLNDKFVLARAVL